MRSYFLLIILLLTTTFLGGQDVIERDYFKNARAKNAAIAAARYAEEGYYYSKFTTIVEIVDTSRLFADTALFFMKRSLMLSDTSLNYVNSDNYRVLDFLNSGQKKVGIADSVIREFYPMIDIKSHNYFGREASLHLSNAVMDFFNASLLLRGDDDQNIITEQYEVLEFEDEVLRLEADEAAFQHAANALEGELMEFEQIYDQLEAKANSAERKSERNDAKKSMERVKIQLDRSANRLEDASFRIEEIRALLDGKYLEDVKGVEAPEHLSQFEKSSPEEEVIMNEEVPDGLVYKIQLGYYPEDVDRENFRGLFPISGETVKKGLARFYAGLFFSYADASAGNAYVRENAISNSFVVPFYNGEKISMSRAVEIERRRGAE